jgi:hypothetical protein
MKARRKVMTNFEKYKTPEEAYQAFKKICATTRCSKCPYFGGYSEIANTYRIKCLYTDEEKRDNDTLAELNNEE